MTDSHKYIFEGEPRKGMITKASFIIIDHFAGDIQQSRQKWRKDKRQFNVNWSFPNGEKQISIPINYLIISKYIRENKGFNSKDFNLPFLECFWLDAGFNISKNFHVSEGVKEAAFSSGIPQQQYGKNYPIKPTLSREGHLFTSFQNDLAKRIINSRTRLITDSNLALTTNWIFDFRTLISDTISLLEITLNQFYNKAEYDSLPYWKFDKSIIGSKHGTRMKDKLGWIHKITGNTINIEPELDSLNSLKALRNHLMHFDPPSLVMALEEIVIWLNQIIDIGLILIRIRNSLGAEISEFLINFIMQKEAIFNPRAIPNRSHIWDRKDRNYFSSTWPVNIGR